MPTRALLGVALTAWIQRSTGTSHPPKSPKTAWLHPASLNPKNFFDDYIEKMEQKRQLTNHAGIFNKNGEVLCHLFDFAESVALDRALVVSWIHGGQRAKSDERSGN